MPKVERVRTADREWFAKTPLVAVLLNGFLRHNGERPKRAQFQKKRGRAGEFDADGFWVERRGTELAEVFDFSAVNVFGVFDVKQHAGVVAGGERVHGAPPRIDNVVCRDRFAGGPAKIIPQVKGVDRPIIGNLPALGQGRFGLCGNSVETGEALEHRGHDAPVRLAGDDCGVKRLGVGAIDDGEVRPVVPLKTPRLAKQQQT